MDHEKLRAAVERTAGGGSFYPDPDWGAVRRLVAKDGGAGSWDAAIEAWAGALRRSCGPFYQQVGGGRTVLVTPYALEVAAPLHERVERHAERILKELPGLGTPPEQGPLVIVHFPGALPYREFVKASYPAPGITAPAEGVCVDRGVLHVAVYGEAVEWVESVIVHQLVHAYLRHLHLPGWLDEGLAMALEERLLAPGATPRAIALSALGGLPAPELELFWKGSPFVKGHAAGASDSELALALARHVLEASYEKLSAFAIAAVRAPDSGRAAARERIGVNLDAVANRLNDRTSWIPWAGGDPANPRLRHTLSGTPRTRAASKSFAGVALVVLIVLIIALVPTCGRMPY